MRPRWLGHCGIYVAASCALLPSCSAADRDCTCAVMVGAEPRALACGENICVSGITVSCIRKDESVQRGQCTPTIPNPPPIVVDAGSMTPPSLEPDRSCEELFTFCNTTCQRPASASADCQATASAGDPEACATFQFTRGIACQP